MTANLRNLLLYLVTVAVLVAVILAPVFLGTRGLTPDLDAIGLGPDIHFPFGTDGLGRDLFARALHGLSLSIKVAGIATVLASLIAVAVALLSLTSKWTDRILSFMTDMMLSLPHLLVLILLAFVAGGGTRGVTLALALSHWPRLARILRAEAMTLRNRPYVSAARAFGRGKGHILRHHILPHLAPQIAVGATLMLPHAVLHEAALTFAGLGLASGTPALGVMLAEGMRYLAAGQYWLTVGPGLVLLTTALLIEGCARSLQKGAS